MSGMFYGLEREGIQRGNGLWINFNVSLPEGLSSDASVFFQHSKFITSIIQCNRW